MKKVMNQNLRDVYVAIIDLFNQVSLLVKVLSLKHVRLLDDIVE